MPGEAGHDAERSAPSTGNSMPPRIVVVPPSHAEIAEIASKMAPAGFELVVSRADRAALDQVLPTAEYIVCYPERRFRRCVLQSRAEAQARSSC